MWSDQYDLNLQLTGKCDQYDSFIKRGKDENEGIIYFFIKNNKIIGACGLGIGGKIGKDIRLEYQFLSFYSDLHYKIKNHSP